MKSSPRVREAVVVILLLALALGLRTYRLAWAPPGITHDEAFNAHDVEAVLRGAHPIFFTANYGREAFFIYLMSGFIALLGRNPVALRLTAVTCGMVGLVLLYLLLRHMFGRRAGVLALGLGAISFWHIFDSRLGLRAISLPMVLTLAFYLLWLGFSGRKRLYWLLSGVVLGLSLYTYLAARIAPLVVLLFLAYLALFHRPQMKGQWLSAALLTLAALAVFAPFGVYLVRHPAAGTQRIQVLQSALQALQAGNPRPVLLSTLQTLGMFTFRGDPEWRYNLPGLPVFDWATGLFFYLGLVLSLVRLRDPRWALLVIWLGVMLSPSAVTDSAPSFLRSVGALPAILALGAVGFTSTWDWVRQRLGRKGELALLVVLGIGFLARGAYTTHDYFISWAQAAEPRTIYKADLAEAARYLNALADRPLVCISSDFAADLDRYVMNVELHKGYTLKWFDGNQSFLLPQALPDADLLYIYTASAPLPDDIARRYFTDLQPVYQPLDGRGVPIITVYRLSPAMLEARRNLTPPSTLQVRFAQDVELLGYDLSTETQQTGMLRAVLYWHPTQRFQRDFSLAPNFFLHLRDREGNLWAQSDRIGYPAWDWEPGDLVLNWFELTIPPDAPLQPYWIHVGMSSAGRSLPVADASGQIQGYDVALDQATHVAATLAPVNEGALPIRTRLDLVYENQLALRGYTLPDEAKPGDPLHLALFWKVLAAPQGDYSVRLRLSDASGQMRFEVVENILPAIYPTSRWHVGSFVRCYHALTLPGDIPSGEYALTVGLLDDDGQALNGGQDATIGKLIIKGRAKVMQGPENIQHPLQAELGEGVALLGYAVEADVVAPGESVHLTLYWQARQPMATSYTVFTHILGADNTMAGQVDSPPDHGESLTSGWIKGEVVEDRYDIPIKPDAPDGEYLLEVGMYDLATVMRLPVVVAGKPDPDGRVVLGKVIVRKK